MVEAVRISKERVEWLEHVIEEFVPGWSLAPVVRALQTLRGVELIALMPGLATAFPIVRPGLFLSYCGRRSVCRPQSV